MFSAIETYDSRIKAELRAYSDVADVHDLPSAHDYWAERFVRPLLAEVGAAGLDALWDSQVAEQCIRRAPESARLVSLGAGNGVEELRLAARLAERGISNLELVLLELNPAMIERGLAYAEELGLSERVRAEKTDLNEWVARESADVYLAVHSLHHVVELEHLYGEVARALHPEGVLLVNDMIGRNGHVRWPEAREVVDAIWRLAPDRYKYNHYLGRVDDEYPDVDCSGEGFEGIRAQDVLPLLLATFHAEIYVTFGNVIDPFVDRVYGPNFDPGRIEDARFIDAVAHIDDGAIDLGLLTPTHLIATFRLRPVDRRYPRDRSPERTVRRPDSEPPCRKPAPDVHERLREAEERAGALAAELREAGSGYEALRARKAVRLALYLAELRHDVRRMLGRQR